MNRLTLQKVRALSLIAMLLIVGLAATYAPARSVQAVQIDGPSATSIKNFGKVNENYYRGSQPTALEFEQLKKLGIKTVIDLREDKKPKAADWVAEAGMRYFNIPLKASRAATDEQTDTFLKLVNDQTNWPVYVHCKGGRHRTGALTAAYRITHDGWTADRAFTEMREYEFDQGFFGGPSAQKKFVFSFYEKYRATIGQK